MNDMSHRALDDVDEFGGLDHLVLPGQDPELLHRIHAALIAEMQPANFIERMWVRDLAIETARIEYIRMADCAVQRLAQDEAALVVAQEAALDDGKQTGPEHADALPGEPGQATRDAGASQAADRALARAHVRHIALIASIVHLENTVKNERDRLIHLYDNRTGIVKAYNDAAAALEQVRDECTCD